MTTATEEETRGFQFGRPGTVEVGDRFHLDHDGGQVVIVITSTDEPHIGGIFGTATDAQAGWFGHWGRIIFYEPIELDKETNATFNQTGSGVSQLKVVPTRLVRVRGGEHQLLLGEWPR